MEKLEFNSNVEMVQVARKLLMGPEPYEYGFDPNAKMCKYRTEDGKRCIFGRLMFGRIPEDSSFWVEDNAGAHVIIKLYPEIKKACPWISAEIAARLQEVHDELANGNFHFRADYILFRADHILSRIERRAKVIDEAK